jgi:hypothetical protein
VVQPELARATPELASIHAVRGRHPIRCMDRLTDGVDGHTATTASPVSTRCHVYQHAAMYGCRPFECRAVGVEWRPEHRLIACAVGPCGVSATVTETSLMAHEDLSGAERVPVRLHQFVQRNPKRTTGILT